MSKCVKDGIDKRHGGAYDRGSADAWYKRDPVPHFYAGDTLKSNIVQNLTPSELADYYRGYADQLESGEHKEWGFATDELILWIAFLLSAWFFIVPLMAWLS